MESSFLSPRAAGKGARVQLAQRDWLVVLRAIVRDCMLLRSDVLSVGQQFGLQNQRERTAEGPGFGAGNDQWTGFSRSFTDRCGKLECIVFGRRAKNAELAEHRLAI